MVRTVEAAATSVATTATEAAAVEVAVLVVVVSLSSGIRTARFMTELLLLVAELLTEVGTVSPVKKVYTIREIWRAMCKSKRYGLKNGLDSLLIAIINQEDGAEERKLGPIMEVRLCPGLQ